MDILNPASPLRSNPPEALFIILSPRILESRNDNLLDRIEAILSSLEEPEDMQVFMSSLAWDPTASPALLRDASADVAAKINRVLTDFSLRNPWFHLVDLGAFLSEHGVRSLHDPRFEANARMYFSPIGAGHLGKTLARHLRASVVPRKKVLVLDLDNTLWGGVLGELGAEGIRVGGENSGHAYVRFQRTIQRLKETGILLAICSKNDEDPAMDTIERHPSMILRKGDFAAWRINWKDKADNIRSLASELNIGLDSVVFFDDSPHERELVRNLVPEVEVLEVPKDPAEYSGALIEYPGFDTLSTTADDHRRTEFYKGETQRRKLRAKGGSLEEYFRSLKMRGTLREAGSTSFERILQLIGKTNQFNLTTRRYDADRLRRLIDSPEWGVYALDLTDSLGESGTTGVVVVRREGLIWTIDNFLLSCRVIGRTVEYAVIRWLAEQAGRSGAEQLLAEFIPTARNEVSKDFLNAAGFQFDPDVSKWRMRIDQLDQIPSSYVELNDAPPCS
jgi:FkbH-like protein